MLLEVSVGRQSLNQKAVWVHCSARILPLFVEDRVAEGHVSQLIMFLLSILSVSFSQYSNTNDALCLKLRLKSITEKN
jgi:hypothetical protein